MMDKKKLVPLLIVLMFFWALMHPLSKLIVGHVPTFLLTLLRFGFGALAIFAFLIATKKKVTIKTEDVLPLVLIGIVGNAIPTAFYFFGLKLTTATSASILLNMSPVIVACLSPLLIKEKLKKEHIFGVVLGFLGMIIVVSGGLQLDAIFSSDYFYGNMIILAGAFGIAVYTIYGKRYVHRYGGFLASAYSVLFAAIALFIVSLCTGEIWLMATLTPFDWFVVLYLGVIIAGFIWAIWYSSIKDLGPTKASSFKLLIPVYATATAILFLGEIPTIETILGGGLVVAGLYLTHEVDLGDLF